MSLDAMKQALEALEDAVSAWRAEMEFRSCIDAAEPWAKAAEVLRAAIEQVQDPETELETYKRLYELRGKALERPCSNCGHQPAKIKAMAQTDSAQSGLAEKIPAKGTLLEQTLKDVWDEMPHTALMDAIIGGTGVMLGNKRIDPASIYKQPDQKPVAWLVQYPNKHEFVWGERPQWIAGAIGIEPLYTAPRQWQGLTGEEVAELTLEHVGYPVRLTEAIEAKLKEKNT